VAKTLTIGIRMPLDEKNATWHGYAPGTAGRGTELHNGCGWTLIQIIGGARPARDSGAYLDAPSFDLAQSRRYLL
jgi:hypothetical protein